MQISSNIENNLAKAVNNVSMPKKSRSYELCVKADALRFAKSYRESVKFYLDSIMMDRNHKEAYWGLAESYKYLTEYKKGLEKYETVRNIKDRINSIKNTQKITRAMKMVAAAKVKKAENTVKAARPFSDELLFLFRKMLATVNEISTDGLKIERGIDDSKEDILPGFDDIEEDDSIEEDSLNKEIEEQKRLISELPVKNKISFISLFIVVYIILINVIITKKTEEVATAFLNDSIDFYVDAESCIVMNEKCIRYLWQNCHRYLVLFYIGL